MGQPIDPHEEVVDIASEQSFPASDPPSWAMGVEEHDGARVVKDSMGEVRVPSAALYGAQTQRAVENFRIGKDRLQLPFIQALGLIKACAARVNGQLGGLPPDIAARVAEVADEIAAGKYREQFVVDVFQTGSGTSTNMNVNEVIANVAGVHPNDHVNQSQSSNDVIPTAMHVAAAVQVRGELLPAMELLVSSLEHKASEFQDVVKIGRTHLQDATPMRLGDEFSGYAQQVRASAERVEVALEGLYELALGGTAVGTGVNAPQEFAARTIGLIAERSGIPFREARNHFEAQAGKDAVVFLSGALRAYAVAFTKIADDVRWLGSGPRGGLGELQIPSLQPGSSIMPGKVNPVIAESVLMVCAQVIGHDAAIGWAGARGNFELNTMMPLMAYDLLDSIGLLSSATRNFEELCVRGLKADRERGGELVERSLAMATMLVPVIGYDRAAEIAKVAYETGRNVREVAVERSGLGADEIARLLALGLGRGAEVKNKSKQVNEL